MPEENPTCIHFRQDDCLYSHGCIWHETVYNQYESLLKPATWWLTVLRVFDTIYVVFEIFRLLVKQRNWCERHKWTVRLQEIFCFLASTAFTEIFKRSSACRLLVQYSSITCWSISKIFIVDSKVYQDTYCGLETKVRSLCLNLCSFLHGDWAHCISV